MRRLVEDAGPAWPAAELRRDVGPAGRPAGTRAVGRAAVAWAYRAGSAVDVTHDRPVGDEAPGGDAYAVRVLATRTPPGGVRWWWECPACRRRCGLLYLPAGRDRLACRVCCRLAYASQSRRGPAPGKSRRPGVVRVVREWRYDPATRRLRRVR